MRAIDVPDRAEARIAAANPHQETLDLLRGAARERVLEDARAIGDAVVSSVIVLAWAVVAAILTVLVGLPFAGGEGTVATIGGVLVIGVLLGTLIAGPILTYRRWRRRRSR